MAKKKEEEKEIKTKEMCVNGSILLGEKLFLNVPLSKAHTA